MNKKNWLIPLACLLVVGTLLGLSANLAKLAAEHGLDPLTLLTWSVLFATAILTSVQAARGRLPRPGRRVAEYSVVSALVGLAAPNLILFAAVPRVGASFVALSIAFPPLLTYLGALALRMERFRLSRATGVGVALAGAALLAALKLGAPGADLKWILGTLLVPVILAIGNLYRTLRWPTGAKPEELAPGMLVAASVMLLTVAVLGGIPLRVPFESPAPLLLIGVQTLAFTMQFPLFFLLQKRGGPVYLSLLGSVAAVVGVPMAILLLGEAPLRGLAPAAVLIAAGVFLLARGGGAKRRRDVPGHRAAMRKGGEACATTG